MLSQQDKLDILDVEARFDWAIDTANIKEWVSHFTEDGVFDASYGKASGSKELTAMMEKLESGFSKGKRHVTANHVIEGDGSGATVRGYLIVFEREKSPSVVATGIYTNTYVKDRGRWKVRHRKLDIDPSWQNKQG
jgi:ketosteroid isomerase-like protein